MTTRRKLFTGLALAAAAAVAGCLDALAPGAPHRTGTVGIVPVFEGAAARDGIPADVDSIVVTISNPNPPPPDTTVGVHVDPGQDSIVITIEVPLSTAATDTRTLTFQALSHDGTVLYSGTSDVTVKAGVPTTADSVRVVYVGPGQNIRSLVLAPRSIGLKPGDTFSAWLVTAFDSAGATILTMPPVLWRTLDPGKATVDALGVVRAVSVGQTWLFATSAASSAIYDSALIVISNSPVAIIGLAPTSAAFGATAGGANPAAQTVAVTNVGVGALAGLGVSGIAYGASEPTGWLSATLSGASAPATLTLQPATGSLAAGVYHATVSVASALASNSPQTLAVTFTVAAGAAISLAPSSLTFSATAAGADPASQTVAVTNGGGGALTGLAVGTITYGSGSGWITTATLDQSTAPATLTVHAATGALAAGTYTATIPITAAAATNSPQSVSVSFTVATGPAIGLATSTVSVIDTVTTADPAATTIAVTNSGGGSLTGLAVGTITYGSGTGWLAASLDQATAPATLTVTLTKGALTPGVYTATFPVTSPVASNSPRTVSVTFDVRALPSIGLSATTATFLDTMTTSDPVTQTVSVTNTGTGSLTGLAVGTITYGSGAGWITTAMLDQTTAPATLTLGVAKGALTPGTYTATVPITAAAATNSPQTIAVTFTIAPMPLIGLSAASVTFTDTLLTTDPATQTVGVTNTGTGSLTGLAVGTITYGSGAGWITTATLDQTTAPATLTLGVAKGALVSGTYTATVPISAGFAGNTPQAISVSFVVQPIPLLRMVVTPGYGVLPPAGTLPLAVQGFDVASAPVATNGLRFVSRTPGVATVDSLTGLVTAVAGGSAVIVAAAPGASGPVSDSTLVAVAGTGVAVALPLGNGGRAFGAALVGDTVHVVIAVNIGAVAGEKLGSYNAQLNWDPAVLQYVDTTATPFAPATLNTTATVGGQLRFGAINAAGAAGPAVVLADIKFVAGAAGGSPLTLALTDLSGIAPAFTYLLPQALVLSGGVQVR